MPTQLTNLAYGRQRGPYFHGLLSQPKCAECPLIYEPKLQPDGPIPARIAFVGEAPDNAAIEQGRGFVGHGDQLLWHMASEIGLSRDDVWVTYACLCKPDKVRLSNGASISRDRVQAMASRCCRQRLLDELIMVNPVVIVPLGKWSLWSVTDIPKAKIYAYRGSRIEKDLVALRDLVQLGLASEPAMTK